LLEASPPLVWATNDARLTCQHLPAVRGRRRTVRRRQDRRAVEPAGEGFAAKALRGEREETEQRSPRERLPEAHRGRTVPGDAPRPQLLGGDLRVRVGVAIEERDAVQR